LAAFESRFAPLMPGWCYCGCGLLEAKYQFLVKCQFSRLNSREGNAKGEWLTARELEGRAYAELDWVEGLTRNGAAKLMI
jgi:hypothetical protein